jgi:hypothetical protein
MAGTPHAHRVPFAHAFERQRHGAGCRAHGRGDRHSAALSRQRLFNNSGVLGQTGDIEGPEVAQFDLITTAHAPVMLGMKHAAPYMKGQGSGSIMNTEFIPTGLRCWASRMRRSRSKPLQLHVCRAANLTSPGEELTRCSCCMATAMETGAALVAGHQPSLSAISARRI